MNIMKYKGLEQAKFELGKSGISTFLAVLGLEHCCNAPQLKHVHFIACQPQRLTRESDCCSKWLYSLSNVPANMKACRRLISKLSSEWSFWWFILWNVSASSGVMFEVKFNVAATSFSESSPKRPRDTWPWTSALWSWSNRRISFRNSPAACHWLVKKFKSKVPSIAIPLL